MSPGAQGYGRCWRVDLKEQTEITEHNNLLQKTEQEMLVSWGKMVETEANSKQALDIV